MEPRHGGIYHFNNSSEGSVLSSEAILWPARFQNPTGRNYFSHFISSMAAILTNELGTDLLC